MGRWVWRTQDSAGLGRGQSQTPYLATVGSLPVYFFLLNTHFILFLFCFASGRVDLGAPPLLLQCCVWLGGAGGPGPGVVSQSLAGG